MVNNVIEGKFGMSGSVRSAVDEKLQELMEEAGIDLTVTVDLFRDGGIHVAWDHTDGENEVHHAVVVDLLRRAIESLMAEDVGTG